MKVLIPTYFPFIGAREKAEKLKNMKDIEKNCLRCKFYRLKDADYGICRVNKDLDKNYPAKRNDDICPKWKDSGQQYFIRVGWIKAQKAEE